MNALLDGTAADEQSLAPLAFAGYAHFTAMQVRDGKIRGLDLHLARLRAASGTLFGQAVADNTVLGYMRDALRTAGDCSMTVTVHLPGGEFAIPAKEVQPRVLVRTGAPSSGPEGPLDLAVVAHERFNPAIKHVGEPAKTWYLRQAVSQGFHDAAFVDGAGRLTEATIWNLAFWDGTSVVWPEGEILTGTTMGIIRRNLDRLGIAQRTQAVRPEDCGRYEGAVVMNSWTPGIAVRRLGDHVFGDAPEFVALLHEAYAREAAAAP